MAAPIAIDGSITADLAIVRFAGDVRLALHPYISLRGVEMILHAGLWKGSRLQAIVAGFHNVEGMPTFWSPDGVTPDGFADYLQEGVNMGQRMAHGLGYSGNPCLPYFCEVLAGSEYLVPLLRNLNLAEFKYPIPRHDVN